MVNTSSLPHLRFARSQYELRRIAALTDGLASCGAWVTRAILSRSFGTFRFSEGPVRR
jgi:hypothetical protein